MAEYKCLNCYHWKACFNQKEWDAAVSKPCRHFIPAADVVPRAVIAEIFADIEKMVRIGIVEHLDCLDAYVKKSYSELKKKYTEGEG